jgi:hypothetical protein
MADDPFRRVRDHLALACNSLTVSQPRTDTLLGRVKAIEQDIYTAHYALPAIIADLWELKGPRPGVVTATAKLTQEPVKVPLPGVADA